MQQEQEASYCPARPASKPKEKSRKTEDKVLWIGGKRTIMSRFLGNVCMQQNEGACAQVCSLYLCRESSHVARGCSMGWLV